MKTKDPMLIPLAGTEEEMAADLERYNRPGFVPESDGEMMRVVFTRLAMAETEIEKALEKGDVTEEEAELLRDKYVKGFIRKIYGDDSI